MKSVLLAFCCALATATAAAAPKGAARLTPDKRVEAAKEAYFEGRFQDAVSALGDILDTADLPRSLRIEALKYQAFSFFVLKRSGEARSTWIKILQLDSKFAPDPVEVSPELLEFFRGVTADYRKSQSPPPASTPPPAVIDAQPATTPPPNAPGPSGPTPPPTWEGKQRGCGIALCLLPLGVGQYANARYVKGVIFTSVELITLGMNVGLYWLNQSQLNAAGVPKDQAAFDKNFRMQNVFFGLFVASAVLGILDAFIFY
jgi:hypothetical protein